MSPRGRMRQFAAFSCAVVRPRTCRCRRAARANDRCRKLPLLDGRRRRSRSNVDRSQVEKTAPTAMGRPATATRRKSDLHVQRPDSRRPRPAVAGQIRYLTDKKSTPGSCRSTRPSYPAVPVMPKDTAGHGRLNAGSGRGQRALLEVPRTLCQHGEESAERRHLVSTSAATPRTAHTERPD